MSVTLPDGDCSFQSRSLWLMVEVLWFLMVMDAQIASSPKLSVVRDQVAVTVVLAMATVSLGSATQSCVSCWSGYAGGFATQPVAELAAADVDADPGSDFFEPVLVPIMMTTASRIGPPRTNRFFLRGSPSQCRRTVPSQEVLDGLSDLSPGANRVAKIKSRRTRASGGRWPPLRAGTDWTVS